MILVDAHADLAWNMEVFGRDYACSVAETRAREAETEIPSQVGHTLLGWDAWLRGRVAVVFATLNATPIRWRKYDWETLCYADSEEAHRLYTEQLDLYHRMVDQHPDKFRMIRSRGDLEEVLSGWVGDPPSQPRLGMVILMEGADCVRNPSELGHWYQRGVRIVGPAWAGTRYSGGTADPGPLTPEGFELLDAVSELGMILDISHMAEEATLQSLDVFPSTLIASHSNPRVLLQDSLRPDRHITDEVIRLLAERGGVMGIVLGNHFLRNGWRLGDSRQGITLDLAADHIDHVCQLVGDASHVGLGTDLDGGFGLSAVPEDLDTVADANKLGPILSARGYKVGEVEAVLGGTWLDVLRRALPES